MPGENPFVHMAHLSNVFRESLLRSAIQSLKLPAGSRGLDAGCGIGLQAMLLAEAVGPAGHITGLDVSLENLKHAEGIVNQTGMADRISFQKGDVNRLPFDENSFDWAWSVDCVGYAPMEPMPPVRELARVVRPGGRVVILAWSSEKLLPGYPLLEARLNATSAGIAPFVKGKKPENHFLRALGWFRQAGLQECQARTFVHNVYAPLSKELRSGLAALFEMRWPGVESELGPQDRTEYRRLCLPESPDFILDQPDYYAFFTYSMFWGRVAG